MISNAPVLHSRADTGGERFARNHAANAALATELRKKLAEVSLGGPEASR